MKFRQPQYEEWPNSIEAVSREETSKRGFWRLCPMVDLTTEFDLGERYSRCLAA